MASRTAALVTGWARRWPAWRLRSTRGSVGTATFPSVKLTIIVEIMLGELGWVDVSRYVLWRDKIVITRGKQRGARRSSPAACAYTLKNGDRRFSPQNAEGPYYGYLTRNVKTRVTVQPGTKRSLRFTGEIPDFPTRWTMGEDRTIQVRAVSRRLRLQSTSENVTSPMAFSINSENPVAWWPLEDETGATEGATGVEGGRPIETSGATFGSSAILPGASGAMLMAAGGTWTTRVDFETVNSRFQVDWHFEFATPPTEDVLVMEVITTGTIMFWRVYVGTDGDTYRIKAFKADNTQVVDVFTLAGDNLATGPIHPRLYVRQAGSDVQWGFAFNKSLGGDFWIDSGTTIANANLGNVARIGVHIDQDAIGGLSYSHPVIYDAYEYTQTGLPAFGYVEETPGSRFNRLAFEVGFPVADIREPVDEHQFMGVQPSGTLDTILSEIEDVVAGVLDEDFEDNFRLTSRSHRYNAVPTMVLDYANDDLFRLESAAEGLEVANDVKIQRPGGSSARATQTTGVNNTSNPEAGAGGIGVKPLSETVNASTDFAVRRHAAYRKERGVIDDQHFDNIEINLARSPHLISAWLECDTGSRIMIINPPLDLGRDTVDQIIEGTTETIAQDNWSASMITSPAEISRVWVVGDPRSRLDCGGSFLDEALTTTETLLDVFVIDRCVWSTADGSHYLIVIGGEDMLLTAATAPAGAYPLQTQTLTVRRSQNGVVKTHSAGAPVHVRYPIRLAL